MKLLKLTFMSNVLIICSLGARSGSPPAGVCVSHCSPLYGLPTRLTLSTEISLSPLLCVCEGLAAGGAGKKAIITHTGFSIWTL